jgi:HK97 family phage major capsid protein
LGGLVGNIAIPKLTGGATAYWVAENGAITESTPTFGQLLLSPNRLGATSDISKSLIAQSSIDVESMVRTDIATVLGIAKDLAAINGSGSGSEPTGILNTSGIATVALGTNGLAPTWASIVNLETEVSQDNADIGALGYLTNAKFRGKAKQVEKASGTAQFLWDNTVGGAGEGTMNGYRAAVTNQVPSNLTKGSSGAACSAVIFGNWADLIIADWEGMDVTVDPFTLATTGLIRITVDTLTDIGVRHAESFSVIVDAITT